MSALPRNARKLVEHLERLMAPGSGASPNEVALARKHVERLLGRAAAPRRKAPARRTPAGPRALLTADAGAPEVTAPVAPPAPPPEAPLRVLPPVGLVTADWSVALAATLAEACGARLILTPVEHGELVSFAGAGDDPEVAAASWSALAAMTEGRSEAWCVGFAASIDERLDATIEARAPRVARVAAWLDRAPHAPPAGVAPTLAVDGADGADGAAAARGVALC